MRGRKDFQRPIGDTPAHLLLLVPDDLKTKRETSFPTTKRQSVSAMSNNRTPAKALSFLPSSLYSSSVFKETNVYIYISAERQAARAFLWKLFLRFPPPVWFKKEEEENEKKMRRRPFKSYERS